MPSIAATDTRWLTLPTPDGPMEAYLAQPRQSGQYPAVLLFMEIFGINPHIRAVAERLAAEGYVVLAPNFYHRTTPNFELSYDEAGMTEGRKHKADTTRQGLLADAQACLAYLDTVDAVKTTDKIGALGFCFGGNVAYTVAVLPQVAATISFYGGGVGDLTDPNAPIHWTADIHGHVLCLFGEQDPLIPIAHMEAVAAELQRQGVSHQVIRYPDAGHGFFCDARSDYNLAAADNAWQHVQQALTTYLK